MGNWNVWHTIGLLVILVIFVLGGLLIAVNDILWMWFLYLLGLALFTMIVGAGLTGIAPLGWLIDEQYTMSLSRLQMFLWTIIVLSALLTAVIVNIKNGLYTNAAAIAIPEQVWLAMGISTTSLVSSPLILSQKKSKKPNMKDSKKTMQRLKKVNEKTSMQDAMNDYSSGQIYQNKDPKEARLYDLVRGEETVNADILDLSRLQNLFFTLILVGSYAASLGSYLWNSVHQGGNPTLLDQFPELASSSVVLLAISHAGYLVSKAVPKQTETTDETDKTEMTDKRDETQ